MGLRNKDGRQLFFATTITMKLPGLKNAMNVTMFMKTGSDWRMNLRKIKDVPNVIPKKAKVTGPDCARHFI